jgi:hypothetical protein
MRWEGDEARQALGTGAPTHLLPWDPERASYPGGTMLLPFLQGFGSGSGINQVNGSGSSRAKMTPTKVEKIKKFHVLKCWMFSLRAEGSLELGHPF